MVDSATTPVAYEALSMEIVVRALLALSIAGINQALAKDHPKTPFAASTRSPATARAGSPGSTCRTA